MRLPIDPTAAVPLYRQVTEGLREAIAAGRLPAGEVLPSVRELAADLRVNYHTVARACQELEEAGLLERRRGGPFRVAAGARPDAGEQQLREELATLARRAISQGFHPARLRPWWEEALTDAAALSRRDRRGSAGKDDGGEEPGNVADVLRGGLP